MQNKEVEGMGEGYAAQGGLIGSYLLNYWMGDKVSFDGGNRKEGKGMLGT